GEVHDGQGAARGVVQRAAHPRLARHHQSHAVAGDVRRRADDGHRRRRRRGAQVHRRPQRAQGVPPARGLLAHGVLPGQAREGVGEVRAPVPGRSGAASSRRGLRQVHRAPRLISMSGLNIAAIFETVVATVPVNVNLRYVDEELTYLFDNADLKVVFTEPDLEDRATRAAATLDWPCPVVTADERYEHLLAEQSGTRPDVGDRSPDDRYA